MVKAWWACGYSMQGYNFGDALTPYIIEKMTGDIPMLASIRDEDPYYLVVGSIINQKWARSNAIIWGSGVIDKTQTAQKGAKFLAVRGPKTYECMIKSGHKCPKVFGDPGLILPFIYPKVNSKKTHSLGIIPHYIDYWMFKDVPEDIKVIDLSKPDVERIIDEICSCEFIISSSLHGVIVSQTYDVPAVWIKMSNMLSGDGIKFQDYFLSVGIKPYEFYLNVEQDGIKSITDNLTRIKQLPSIIDNFDATELIRSCPF